METNSYFTTCPGWG